MHWGCVYKFIIGFWSNKTRQPTQAAVSSDIIKRKQWKTEMVWGRSECERDTMMKKERKKEKCNIIWMRNSVAEFLMLCILFCVVIRASKRNERKKKRRKKKLILIKHENEVNSLRLRSIALKFRVVRCITIIDR